MSRLLKKAGTSFLIVALMIPGADFTSGSVCAQRPPASPAAQPPGPAGQKGGAGKSAGAAAKAAPAATPAPGLEAARPMYSVGKGLQVSLNFDDADVFSVVQTIFGEILKVNYVIDPRIKGRVNFRSMAPVPRDQVLPIMEVILRINGIGVVEDGGLYRIVPIGDISREPSPVAIGRNAGALTPKGKSLVQVIPITYMQSSDIVKMVAPFVSANAVLIDVPKSNQVIVVDTDANVKRLLSLVEIFDSEQLKRRSRVHVYPIQNGKAKEVATLLQQIFLGSRQQPSPVPDKPATPKPGSAAAAPPAASSAGQVYSGVSNGESIVSDMTKIFPDEVTNSIVVLATPEDYETIRETISRLDTVPRQVVIEGVIASVDLKDNLSLGLAYSIKTNISTLNATIGVNTAALNAAATGVGSAGFSLIGIDSAGSVRALITALATDSKAKLLAAPHILVSDNREARIQVGQQVPIVTSETYGTPGVAPQRNIQYRDIGIILKAKPRVNEGGLVTLELSQEISTYSTINLGVTDTEIIINKTEATTNLVVQDGQTIVIGGLIREDKQKSRTGIPFLSRIPLIGWLFGNTDDNLSRTEIIILLTPRVIKNMKEAREVTSDYVDKITESGGIKKEELLKRPGQKTGAVNDKAPAR